VDASGLYCILHVGNIDSITGAGGTIDNKREIWLTDNAEQPQVRDPRNLAHHRHDLIALGLEGAEIVSRKP
jgi:hypothetical protein